MMRAWIRFCIRYGITAATGALLIAGGVRLWTAGMLQRMPGYTAAAALAARAAGAASGFRSPPEPEPYLRRTRSHPPETEPAAAAAPDTALSPPPPQAGNPYKAEYRKAAQDYEAFWKKVRALEAEHAEAEGARRMELADALRVMKGPDVALRTAYEDARARYRDWERRHAGGNPGSAAP
jgi:hypothetical protein